MNKLACPETIFVEITNICNFDCTFCPNHLMTREKGMMDYELFKKIVLDAKACGVERFNLWIMGEPFLHPKFFDFVKFAKENKLKLSLISNGGLFTEGLIDRFLSLDLSKDDNILISYLTPNICAFELRNAKTLDFDTYKNGIFRLIEKKVEKKASVEIMLMYIINIFADVVNVPGLITGARGVLDSIKELADFSHDVQRKAGINFNFSIPSLNKIKGAIKNCREIKIEFLPGVFFNLKWLTNWGKVILPDGLKVIPSHRGYCAYPFQSLGVFWNGEVTLCCDDYNGELVIGDLRQQTLSEIFNGEKAQKIRSEMNKGVLSMPRCQACQGKVMNKEGKILKGYYKRYYLSRVFRHFRVHGLRKTIRKIWGEIRV